MNETWFVPFDAAGAAVQLDIESWTPLEIQARFLPDMQMMWRASLGLAKEDRNPALHAFTFRDKTGHYYGLIGSADGENTTPEQYPSDTAVRENVLRLSAVAKGRATRLIVIAGSVTGQEDAAAIYHQISSNVSSLREVSPAHYREFLAHTTSITRKRLDFRSARL